MRSTRIRGDMIGQLDPVEAKTAALLGDTIGGMIADEHSAAAPVGIDHLDGGRLIGPQQYQRRYASFRIDHRGPVRDTPS